ncbi:MAG: hypothetical protein HQK65_01035, partial [Desulfamplus sp.]|nr:hypothetical protein [Desulfamplus sp.]
MEKRICPHCQSQTIRELPNSVYLCKDCDKDFQIIWHISVYEDKTLWDENAFKNYPSVIKNEYLRLKALFKEGQTYGALLQIKDVFEVLLKFPILVAVSQIYANIDRDDQDNTILKEMIAKNLSLGDWERIGGLICKSKSKTKIITYNQIKSIMQIFNKNNITNWRNETIGHGALQFDNTDDFKKSVEEKLQIIKNYLENNKKLYSALTIDDESKTVEYSDGKITIKIELYPYILVEDACYLFDYYKYDKSKTFILDYHKGKKQGRDIVEINNLRNLIFQDIKQAEGKNKDKVNSGHLESSEKIVDSFEKFDDILRPIFILKKIKNAITGNDGTSPPKKSIILRMDRGTGKSTVARSMIEDKLFNDYGVRLFVINQSYRNKRDDFISFIINLDEDNRIKAIPNRPFYEPEKATKQDIADSINWYKDAYYEILLQEKFIIVIDGLDELTSDEIFDLIPEPDMLSEGVHIVMTARSDKEISKGTKENIDKLKIEETITITRETKIDEQKLNEYINENNNIEITNYTQLMVRYLNKNSPDFIKEAKVILEKAEYRFLHLKLINECLKTGVRGVSDLPDGDSLFGYYLKEVEKACGKKIYDKMMEVLIIVATAYEKLTLEEIARLYDRSDLTFSFLALITTLKGFMKEERSNRGNLYSIQHEEVVKLIKDNYKPIIKVKAEEYIKWTKEIAEDFEKENRELTDENLYLAAYGLRYERDYLDSYELYKDIYIKILNLGVFYQETFGKYADYENRRIVAIYDTLINIMEALDKAGKLHDKNDLA